MKKLVCLIIVLFAFLTGCGSSDKLQEIAKNLTEYNMIIDVDCDEKILNVRQEIDYLNQSGQDLDNILFHLYPNAFKNCNSSQAPVSEYNFDKAYPNGFDSGYIEISSTKIKDININYEIQGEEENILCVPLLEALKPNKRVNIEMNYIVKIPNVTHRFGYGENTINVGNFYPIACVFENGDFVQDGYHFNGDPFYSEMANYDIEIRYDSNYTICCSGEEKTEVEDMKKITTSRGNAIRDFAFVLSDKFQTQIVKDNGVLINYSYYNDDNPGGIIDLIKKALTTFEDIIGDYPYSTLTVVQSNFLHGGMEYPNMVLVSDAVINREDYYNVVVHEIAHQWFYNIIGNDEYNEAWLDEGLTEYVTALFFEINPEYGIEYSKIIGDMLKSYQLFVDIYTDIFGDINTSMTRNLSQYASEAEYTYCIYVKGVLMLDHLRELIGDSAFYLGLKNYYNANAFKIAKQKDFVTAFQKASNKNIEGIIQTWLNGTAILQNVQSIQQTAKS